MLTSDESALRSTLVRSGFFDADVALSNFSKHPDLTASVDLFSQSANPDQALQGVVDILDTNQLNATIIQPEQWRRLIALCGHSAALSAHLVRHPAHAIDVINAETFPGREELRSALLASVHAKQDSHGFLVSEFDWDSALNALRVEYHKWACVIAAQDLEQIHESPRVLDTVAQTLAHIADAVLEAALACARSEVTNHHECVMSVVSLGKCGGNELNYVSDVDVIFVVDSRMNQQMNNDESEHGQSQHSGTDVIAIGTQLAKLLMQACSQVTSAGSIWQVDPNLRPEGRSGALVRTVTSYLAYYQQWAHGWEFQAFMKARVSAGDANLGDGLINQVLPMVWQAASRPGFVQDVQQMRAMVLEQIPVKEFDRELKLGRGGLRDVEFAVQLLQLVHGRTDVMIRSSNTLLALEQLATWGYVGRQDAANLAAAYRFLRTLEHRIQLVGMQRTHLMPTEESALRQLGRSIGNFGNPVQELEEQWKQHARIIRRIHEKLFYRPLLAAVAHLDDDSRLSKDAALDRLRILGYENPQSALGHIQALTSGVSRRAIIQKTLLPVLLEWFSATPNPDEGLLGFRNVSDALGATPWFLRLLRDESITAQRLVTLLGSGKYVTNLLLRAPQAVQMLADDQELAVKDKAVLQHEAHQIIARHEEVSEAVVALRSLRRRELFRISASNTLDLIDVHQVGEALSNLNDVVIEATFAALRKELEVDFEFIVIAMGRYGGFEASYASDVDVMYCSRAHSQEQINKAQQLASKMTMLLGTPSVDPELKLDADLRPEGRNGALVQSIDAFEKYYNSWSSPWEAQALLRARVVCGDESLQQQFEGLINRVRYASDGVSESALLEMRKLKARMESERLPRGVEPTNHIKLGPGGLSDVEWLVQLQQLRFGFSQEQLRVTNTLDALKSCAELSLLPADEVQSLRETWILLSRLRNALTLVSGSASDVLPKNVHIMSQVAHMLGYGSAASTKLVDEYLRCTRRSRTIMMREFYGVTN